MLLSIFAFLVGAAIGRTRGGRARALTTTPLNKAGWLAAGISGVLIVTLIGPSQPILWMLVTYASFAYFALRNLQLTGMVVLLIGMLMNLVPMLANFAVPVSEQALISVGEVANDGSPIIDGIRESTATTSLNFFGDVIPVPIFGVVVSLGDLVIAVALADIAMNILLREKARREDENAFSYKERSDDDTADIDLREPAKMPTAPTPTVKRNGPAHSAGRRPRMRPLTSISVPAHAAPSTQASGEEADQALEPAPAKKAMPATAIYAPEHAASATPEPPPPTPAAKPVKNIVLPPEEEPVIVLNDQAKPHGYLTTTAHLNTTKVDNRPIIDLTNSPTEEQLMEFMRRRAEADRALLERGESSTGGQPHRPQRQGRRTKRSNHKVDA